MQDNRIKKSAWILFAGLCFLCGCSSAREITIIKAEPAHLQLEREEAGKTAQEKPAQQQPAQIKPEQAIPVQTEPVKTEPAQAEPVKTEPVQTKSVPTEPVQAKAVQETPQPPAAAEKADNKPVPAPQQQPPEKIAPKPEVAERPKKPVIKHNFAFGVGEKVTFAIRYLGITAGRATVEVVGITNVNGYNTYHISSTAKSLPFFSMFHKVDDLVESYIDVRGLFSRMLTKRIEEGNFHKKSELYFDQDKHTVKDNDDTYAIPPEVQDILSAFFYFRTLDVKPDKDPVIDVYAEGKVWKLKVQIEGREKISVSAGEFDCLRIKPFMQFESIFKQTGDVTIWVTDDVWHIPVLMKSSVAIGSINAVLTEATLVDQGLPPGTEPGR